MTLFALFIIMILLLAWIIDTLLSDSQVVEWRLSTAELRSKFHSMNVREITLNSNIWFLGLFEAIYGKPFFSKRRLVTSIVSTLLATAMVSLFIEFANLPAFHVIFRAFLSQAALLLFINLIADYLSLQETYWIMKWSQKKGLFGISLLVIVDLLLTAIIYAAVVCSVAFLIYYYDIDIEQLIGFLPEPVFDLVDMNEGGLIYLSILAGSTYVTSTLWIGFAVCAFFVRTMDYLSPTIRRILKVIGQSEKPAFASAGFICALSILTFGTYRTAIWIIN